MGEDQEQPAPRRRRKEARPQEIMAAALDLFAAKGFAATRLDEVAAGAGVSKGTLYLYFTSKEQLFQAVIQERLLPHLAALEAELDGVEGPVMPLIERFLETLALRVVGTKLAVIPRLVLAEAPRFPAIAEIYARQVIRPGLGLLGRLVRRGIASGELRPVAADAVLPSIMAPLLLTLLAEGPIRAAAGGALPAGGAMLAAHLDLLRHGLLALPEPAAAAGAGEVGDG